MILNHLAVAKPKAVKVLIWKLEMLQKEGILQ